MRPPSLAKRLRDRIEAAAVVALLAAARWLPVGATVRFGERLGALVARFDRRRRRVALANLELAYRDELAPAARERMVRGVYRHLGRFFFEYLLLLARRDLRPLSRFIEIEGLDHARAAIERHGAAIFVTLHQGHWELLGAAFSQQVTPLHAVMQPLRNPRLNELLVARRSALGMEMIDRIDAVPALFKALRRRQSVALLCDLNEKVAPEFADFFGVAAATVRAPVVLALRTGAPILCGTSFSTGEPLRYRGVIAPPIEPDRAADPATETTRIVTAMNAQLEAFVRAHPEQWNWIHPRWKTRPPGEPRPT